MIHAHGKPCHKIPTASRQNEQLIIAPKEITHSDDGFIIKLFWPGVNQCVTQQPGTLLGSCTFFHQAPYVLTMAWQIRITRTAIRHRLLLDVTSRRRRRRKRLMNMGWRRTVSRGRNGRRRLNLQICRLVSGWSRLGRGLIGIKDRMIG